MTGNSNIYPDDNTYDTNEHNFSPLPSTPLAIRVTYTDDAVTNQPIIIFIKDMFIINNY